MLSTSHSYLLRAAGITLCGGDRSCIGVPNGNTYVNRISFFPAAHVECVELIILILTSMWLQLLSAKRGAKRCRPSTSSWQCLCCSFSSSLLAHGRHEPTTSFPCVMSRSDNWSTSLAVQSQYKPLFHSCVCSAAGGLRARGRHTHRLHYS